MRHKMIDTTHIVKEYGMLSEFKDCDIELFRSIDLINTSTYFTNDKYSKESFFEVILIKQDYQKLFYIKYPNTDYFIESTVGGGSSRGNMEHTSVNNMWHDEKIFIKKHDGNMLLCFGDIKCGDINFLSRVAHIKQKSNHNDISFVNYDQIEDIFKMKYLKLPINIRTIVHLYRTNDENPTFYMMDCAKHTVKAYETFKFRVINDDYKEYNIVEHMVMRDGGTTTVFLRDENGNEHKFFSPTKFKPDGISTFDDKPLVKVSEVEKMHIINKYNILVN